MGLPIQYLLFVKIIFEVIINLSSWYKVNNGER